MREEGRLSTGTGTRTFSRAAILSLFIPGLGQLYKGHFVQAILWFLVVGAAYGLLYWFIFALVPIVLHIICILQAYFMDNE